MTATEEHAATMRELGASALTSWTLELAEATTLLEDRRAELLLAQRALRPKEAHRKHLQACAYLEQTTGSERMRAAQLETLTVTDAAIAAALAAEEAARQFVESCRLHLDVAEDRVKAIRATLNAHTAEVYLWSR